MQIHLIRSFCSENCNLTMIIKIPVAQLIMKPVSVNQIILLIVLMSKEVPGIYTIGLPHPGTEGKVSEILHQLNVYNVLNN